MLWILEDFYEESKLLGVPTSAPGSATVVGCKTVSEKIEKLIWHLFMIIVVTNE